MPSPVGHALGGIAAAWGVLPRRDLAGTAIIAAFALAPDLDLLAGEHRGISHSVGAVVVAGLAAAIISRRPRWGLAIALAWASHVVLDWLSHDTRPPAGVMALWPFTREYYKAAVEIFPAVSRRYWLSEFWGYNLKAAAVEVAILGPVAAVAIWRRVKRR